MTGTVSQYSKIRSTSYYAIQCSVIKFFGFSSWIALTKTYNMTLRDEGNIFDKIYIAFYSTFLAIFSVTFNFTIQIETYL